MKCVVNIFNDKINHLEFKKWNHGTAYSGQDALISKNWNLQKLGFHLEILDSGSFSCPYHHHKDEEEIFLVIEGSATVRHNEEFYEIHTGDLVAFKTGEAHQFFNHTKFPFKFLALSNLSENDICHYPDSEKTLDRKEKKLTQHGLEISDYWKDEENPMKKWPREIIDKDHLQSDKKHKEVFDLS